MRCILIPHSLGNRSHHHPWYFPFIYPLIGNDNSTDLIKNIEEGIACFYDANYLLMDVVTKIPENKDKANIVIVKAQLDKILSTYKSIHKYHS